MGTDNAKGARSTGVPARKPVPTTSSNWASAAPVEFRYEEFELRPLSCEPESDVLRSAITATVAPEYESYDHRARDDRHMYESPIALWKPFYLRRTTLAAFIFVFIGLFIALAALYAYSQRNQGLGTVNDRDHYLWTYGPTAVLTIVAAFWGQVDYRIKQLMPWRAMATGPQPPSKSLLLDYVSPISLTAIYIAFKHAHYTVAFVVISSLLIKSITIFSTGLFTLQWSEITVANATLTAENKFDGSVYDWSNVDARPASIVDAVENLGLDYPAGTTGQYAVQSFSNPYGSNSTLEGVVDVFSASLDCESAHMVVLNTSWYDPYGYLFHAGPQFTVNVSTSSCTTTGIAIEGATGIDSGSPYNDTLTYAYGFARVVTCNGTLQGSQDQRILISLGLCQEHTHWNGSATTNGTIGLTLPLNETFKILESINLLCIPRYTIQKAAVSVTHNSTGQNLTVDISRVISTGSTVLDKVKPVDIALGVFASLNESAGLYLGGTEGDYPDIRDAFFTLLGQKHPVENTSVASPFWFDAENLANLSSDLYGSIAVQVASQRLLVPTIELISGTATINEPRLFVRILSLGLMEAVLAMLAIFAIYLFATDTGEVVTHDPGPISGTATIVGASPDLSCLLQEQGTPTLSSIVDDLEGNLYYTELSPQPQSAFRIRTISEKEHEYRPAMRAEGSPTLKWWQPLILKRPSRVLIVLIPIIYIVLLEALYQISVTGDGLINLSSDSYIHYAWTYIPALSMVGVHLLFSALDFSIRLDSPYTFLRTGTASASRSVLDHPLSMVALHELWVAGRNRQFAVFMTTITVLLAPLLTIVVSGLYTAESYTQTVGLRQLTGWNFNASADVNLTLLDNAYSQSNQTAPDEYYNATSTSLVTDLIVELDLPYPSWTFGELALSLVRILDTTSANMASILSISDSLTARIPSARGALNCTIIPHDSTHFSYWLGSGNRSVVRFNTTLPDGCSSISMDEYLPLSAGNGYGSGPAYFGSFGLFTDPLYTSNISYGPTWCPVLGCLFGYKTPEALEQYTWLACSTNVERVDADVTLTLPEYSVSTDQPPQAIESTATIMPGYSYVDNSKGKPVTETGPNIALDGAGDGVDYNSYLTFYNSSTTQSFDNFFSALVEGPEGIPASEMLGEANVPRLISAVQHLYRIITAQLLNVNEPSLRSAEPADIERWSSTYPLNGTLMIPDLVRLKQSVVSTRILEGILAALTLCALVTFYLMDTRELLPNNPSNIAAVASLLAGSEMLNIAAQNSQRSETHQSGQQDAFQGYFFSLGWWGQGINRRFGIDIGKAEKAS